MTLKWFGAVSTRMTWCRIGLLNLDLLGAWMPRALESTWPRNAPWRAHVGSAWCTLCHDSPIDSTDSHHTLPERSRERSGRLPVTWQMELMDQVTWWNRPTRTSVAQKKAVTAPGHDIDQTPPASGGRNTDTAAQAG